MASGRITKVKGKVLDIPNPPTIGTATAGAESASVVFTADSSGKGGPTRSYIAKSNPGNITATGSTSPINVTGLTAGTSYTISVAGVNETGTSEYSSASNSITALVSTSYESIATITVGSGGASNVEFTSIPSSYEHLQIRGMGRISSGSQIGYLQINGDTTATNYYVHALEGDGSTIYSYAVNSYPRYTSLTSNAGQFGVTIIDILNYDDTNKYKTVRALAGLDSNGTGGVTLYSGLWKNTNAITSVKLIPNYGASFTEYTTYALYGIKGA